MSFLGSGNTSTIIIVIIVVVIIVFAVTSTILKKRKSKGLKEERQKQVRLEIKTYLKQQSDIHHQTIDYEKVAARSGKDYKYRDIFDVIVKLKDSKTNAVVSRRAFEVEGKSKQVGKKEYKTYWVVNGELNLENTLMRLAVEKKKPLIPLPKFRHSVLAANPAPELIAPTVGGLAVQPPAPLGEQSASVATTIATLVSASANTQATTSQKATAPLPADNSQTAISVQPVTSPTPAPVAGHAPIVPAVQQSSVLATPSPSVVAAPPAVDPVAVVKPELAKEKDSVVAKIAKAKTTVSPVYLTINPDIDKEKLLLKDGEISKPKKKKTEVIKELFKAKPVEKADKKSQKVATKHDTAKKRPQTLNKFTGVKKS